MMLMQQRVKDRPHFRGLAQLEKLQRLEFAQSPLDRIDRVRQLLDLRFCKDNCVNGFLFWFWLVWFPARLAAK